MVKDSEMIKNRAALRMIPWIEVWIWSGAEAFL